MVGRVREQARIAAWLADDGSAYPLLIEGEAGMGKSTLVRFAMHKAEELGVPVVLVAGSRIERYTPYYVWRSVLASLLLRPGAASTAWRTRC